MNTARSGIHNATAFMYEGSKCVKLPDTVPYNVPEPAGAVEIHSGKYYGNCSGTQVVKTDELEECHRCGGDQQ